MEERLQKILARYGIASRRHAEEMIAAGRVQINGQIVQELGYKVDAAAVEIKVDGKVMTKEEKRVYLLFYKPNSCLCTVTDPQGRKTVLDYFPAHLGRIYPVGRLDYDTSGLLLLTNDGDFAHRVLHPSHEIKKTYEASIKGPVSEKQLTILHRGVLLEDGKTAPATVKIARQNKEQTILHITIHEGKKRQVRRMIKAVGLSLLTLKRIQLGSLTLDGLKMGAWRYLTDAEIRSFDMIEDGKKKNGK